MLDEILLDNVVLPKKAVIETEKFRTYANSLKGKVLLNEKLGMMSPMYLDIVENEVSLKVLDPNLQGISVASKENNLVSVSILPSCFKVFRKLSEFSKGDKIAHIVHFSYEDTWGNPKDTDAMIASLFTDVDGYDGKNTKMSASIEFGTVLRTNEDGLVVSIDEIPGHSTMVKSGALVCYRIDIAPVLSSQR